MPSSTDSSSFHQNVIPYNGTQNNLQSLEDWAQTIPSLVEKEHRLKHYKEGIGRKESISNWIPLLLLIGLVSVAFAKAVYRKRFSMLFQTLMNWKLAKQIIRYEKVYTHPVNVLMTFNFILCFTLFFGILRSMHLSSLNNISLSFILIPLLIYLLIKLVVYKFSGWLMNEKEVVEEYIFQSNLFNKYLGVAFLSLTILLIYSSIDFIVLSYFGVCLLIFSLLLQIVRGIKIGIENGKNLFFIILYLCTLEILPWLVIGKWINNHL